MAVRIAYFVHGTTVDNEQGLSSGWSDAELSELGIEQSKRLPHQVTEKSFDVVFSSDLRRAVDSANISFGNKFPIVIDPRLRECNYGEYNAKPSTIVDPMQQGRITKRFPGGESYEDVKKRILEFLKDLKKNFDGKYVAIVSHKAPQLAIDVIIKKKTWKQAFEDDWRKRQAWQPGWEYEFD